MASMRVAYGPVAILDGGSRVVQRTCSRSPPRGRSVRRTLLLSVCALVAAAATGFFTTSAIRNR